MVKKQCHDISLIRFKINIFSSALVICLRMDFNKWNPFWTTCFGVMAFLIIVGNILTIATLKKTFRKRPHFLVISLAFADLLVGWATTLYVIVEYRLLALSLYNLLDVFASHSSVFYLAVISLERLHATLRPFRHQQLSLKVYWVAIATPVLGSSLCLCGLLRSSFERCPPRDIFFEWATSLLHSG